MTAEAYAIELAEHGGPEVLRVVPLSLPEPGPHEVLVRHEAVGLNFIDTYYRTGLYGAELPHGLGNEAAGVAERVGAQVEAIRPGDRVGYFTGPPGAYASHRLVDADRLVVLPDSIATDVAAAAMLKGKFNLLYGAHYTEQNTGVALADFLAMSLIGAGRLFSGRLRPRSPSG